MATCLSYTLTLKTEAIFSSEISLNFYRTIPRHISGDSIYSCESLRPKEHWFIFFLLFLLMVWGETESTFCTPASSDCMSPVQVMECELTGETEILGENLMWHFVRHKSDMTCLRSESCDWAVDMAADKFILLTLVMFCELQTQLGSWYYVFWFSWRHSDVLTCSCWFKLNVQTRLCFCCH